MNKFKRSIYTALAVMAASMATLCGCSSGNVESPFDSPRPWHDGSAGTDSYEKLTYAVSVYDETNGAAEDKRTQIADGVMTFIIDEHASFIDEYTSLKTSIFVSYYADAPAPDAGLTDVMNSEVVFSTDSLYAKQMQKTIVLADREGADNLSYTVSANYANDRKAAYQALNGNGDPVGEKKEITLPNNAQRDNEMLFMLARSQALAAESTTAFNAVNVFDTFLNDEYTEYTIAVQTLADPVTFYPGEWVKKCGVEGAEDEDGNTVYPVACHSTMIGINSSKSGPPYTVLFTQDPFTIGNKSHAKIPVRIGYRQYKNGGGYRYTEYTLTDCSFGE